MPIGNPGEITPEPNTRYNTLVVGLMHPHSRGSVHISSADPSKPPAIDPNYLADPGVYPYLSISLTCSQPFILLVDLELLLEGVKFVRKVQVSGKLGEHHVEHVHPPPDADDDKIRQWIKTYSA